MPDFFYEEQFSYPVAGIDEAGRGPWAGPVVAAAVILDKDSFSLSLGFNDSKALSAKKRQQLAEYLHQHHHIGIGLANVEEIDQLNILQATKLAMKRAYTNLNQVCNAVLIDGNQPVDLPCITKTIVKGDQKSFSIAAASIIAKVTRDAIMSELANKFPHYLWQKNAGYGTKDHQLALQQYGPTIHHRKSFAPIRKLLAS